MAWIISKPETMRARISSWFHRAFWPRRARPCELPVRVAHASPCAAHETSAAVCAETALVAVKTFS